MVKLQNKIDNNMHIVQIRNCYAYGVTCFQISQGLCVAKDLSSLLHPPSLKWNVSKLPPHDTVQLRTNNLEVKSDIMSLFSLVG